MFGCCQNQVLFARFQPHDRLAARTLRFDVQPIEQCPDADLGRMLPGTLEVPVRQVQRRFGIGRHKLGLPLMIGLPRAFDGMLPLPQTAAIPALFTQAGDHEIGLRLRGEHAIGHEACGWCQDTFAHRGRQRG